MNRRDLLVSGAALTLTRGARSEEKSLVERLGHPREARLLMIHADDIGMCRSVNRASTEALLNGVVSSGSVMVPCPWFPEAAEWSQQHPQADLGLHLTLTSEWRHYRWRPVAPPDRVKGLLDPDGFMWRRVEDVVKHASSEEVALEIRAQIDRARQFGMKPTHVDSHMGTLFAHPKFFEVYLRVARETRLLPMIPGPTPDILEEAKALGVDYAALTRELAAQGFVVLDRLSIGLNANGLEPRRAELKEFVRSLKPGVTELIVHLAGDDDEIRHVTGNWERRYLEYRLCTDPDTRAFIRDQGVKLVGYRELAALW